MKPPIHNLLLLLRCRDYIMHHHALLSSSLSALALPRAQNPLRRTQLSVVHSAHWELCSLVSDQHKTPCSTSFLRARHLWKQTLTRQDQSRNLQNSGSLQVLFSLIILVILWVAFSFTLSATRATAVISPGNYAPF